MNNTTLYYCKPADVWENAMPLGNGHIGAMVYGGVDHETIQLNHDTFWSGTVRPYPIESKKEYLPQARKMLFEEKYFETKNYIDNHLMGEHSESYLPVGFMNIRFRERGGLYSDYKRTLSLEEAVMNVEYKRLSYLNQNENPSYKRDPSYKRVIFISKPDNVMVMKITADKERAIKLTADFESDVPIKKYIENNILYITGKAPSHMGSTDETINFDVYDDKPSISYKLGIKPEIHNGQLRFIDNKIVIDGADEVIFYITLGTDFISFSENPRGQIDCKSVLENAVEKGFDRLLKAHMEDYKKLYERSMIQIDDECSKEEITTDKRLEQFKNGRADKGLYELLFNFGKYLMIAGSREGTQPTGLFGIWSGIYQQAWYGGYTTNVNTQMNYWGAETCNLSECHEPFLKMAEEFSVAGVETAQKHFGCRGFCVNHNSDIWRHTLPMPSGADSGYWPMAGAWICRDLWERYCFTGDLRFLEEKAFPITKKAAEFMLDWLVEDKDGYLVTMPSISPENHFYDKEKRVCGICIASTMDMSIIKELFNNLLKMQKILNFDDEICTQIKNVLPRLYPIKIASDGTICEYFKEFEEVDPGHRHLSHLYGLYPSDMISENTPELYKAAERSLLKRLKNGGGQTGWSGSWVIHLWARLHKGNPAAEMLDKLIQNNIYYSLLDSHPPFQIDGNYGIMSGIAEMLLQSINGEITLLPALPDSWKSGSFKGLCARGGYVVDAMWDNGIVKSYRVTDRSGKVISQKTDVKVGYSFVPTQDI